MTEKIYLETSEKCPGSVCFPLLMNLLFFFLVFFLKEKTDGA